MKHICPICKKEVKEENFVYVDDKYYHLNCYFPDVITKTEREYLATFDKEKMINHSIKQIKKAVEMLVQSRNREIRFAKKSIEKLLENKKVLLQLRASLKKKTDELYKAKAMLD